MAERPELVPDVAVFVLETGDDITKEERHANDETDLTTAAAATAGVGFMGGARAQAEEVVIGVQCDRTGPTQIVGTVLCPAMQDYYELSIRRAASTATRSGHEIDNEYKVPPAVEAYQRQKQQGAVSDDALRHAA